MTPRPVYLLAGATATGKSAVAAVLAREMGAAILSADSMLVYRGMDVGTAKPPPEERAEFSMGGVDLVTPADDFSAGEWLRRAAQWAATIPAERPVVVAGGTGLYFTALLRGLDAPWAVPPPEYPVLRMDRARLRERLMRRIDAMFESGLEAEMARLRAEFPHWSRTAAAAIGYKEFFTPPEVPGRSVREAIYYRTSKFAKRQDTWFRHQSTPMWVDVADDLGETARRVRAVWRAHGPWRVPALEGGEKSCGRSVK